MLHRRLTLTEFPLEWVDGDVLPLVCEQGELNPLLFWTNELSNKTERVPFESSLNIKNLIELPFVLKLLFLYSKNNFL